MTRSRALSLVIVGAVIWLLAALLIRGLAAAGAFSSHLMIAGMFVVTAAGAFGAVLAVRMIYRLRPGGITPAVALISLVGMLMDGVALTWAPDLYSHDGALRAIGGACLLWTVGAGLLSALILDSRSPA